MRSEHVVQTWITSVFGIRTRILRARHARDHIFKTDVLTWEAAYVANEEDQVQESRKRRKERKQAMEQIGRGTRPAEGKALGKQGSREAGKQAAAKEASRKARWKGSRKRETQKQGTRRVVHSGWHIWKQGRRETKKA